MIRPFALLALLPFAMLVNAADGKASPEGGASAPEIAPGFYIVPGQDVHKILSFYTPEKLDYKISIQPPLVSNGQPNSFGYIETDGSVISAGGQKLAVQASDSKMGSAIVSGQDIAVLRGNSDGRYLSGQYIRYPNRSAISYDGQWVLTENKGGKTHYVLIASLDTPALIRVEVTSIEAPACCTSQASHKMTLLVDGKPLPFPMSGASAMDVYGKEVGIYMSSFDAGTWFKAVGKYKIEKARF